MGKVVHCKKEQYDVLIDRTTKWGNPFSHKEGTKAQYKVATREEAIKSYRLWLFERVRSSKISLDDLAALSGKTLGCWCHPKACHGDVLTKAADWAKTQLETECEVL